MQCSIFRIGLVSRTKDQRRHYEKLFGNKIYVAVFLSPTNIRYSTFLLLSTKLEKIEKEEFGDILKKMSLCSEAHETSGKNNCDYLSKFFDQTTLSESKILNYKYNFDNTNMDCSILSLFKENGNVETVASSDCYIGGKINIDFIGNFLASEKNDAKIKVIMKIDNEKESEYFPNLGYGGQWAAKAEIHLPNEFRKIKITIHVEKKDGFDYFKNFELGALDTYKPKAVINFKGNQLSPVIENHSRLCSGETIAVVYDFQRILLRGVKSNGSYYQFAPSVKYYLEIYDQNNIMIRQVKENMNFTYQGQYIFFKAPPCSQYFKIKFEAQNAFESQIFLDPEAQNKMHHIYCN